VPIAPATLLLKTVFLQETVTLGRLYLDAHRETSSVDGALLEESDQFHVLRTTRLVNLGPVGSHYSRIDFREVFKNEGYYSNRIVYTVFHSSPSLR
jgi:hypothetical protein